jgi:hypothetical protein
MNYSVLTIEGNEKTRRFYSTYALANAVALEAKTCVRFHYADGTYIDQL